MRVAKGRKIIILQEDFGAARKDTLNVNECFNYTTFKSYEELLELININEGTYLLLKKILLHYYSETRKYPQRLVNKNYPVWNYETLSKLFTSKH